MTTMTFHPSRRSPWARPALLAFVLLALVAAGALTGIRTRLSSSTGAPTNQAAVAQSGACSVPPFLTAVQDQAGAPNSADGSLAYPSPVKAGDTLLAAVVSTGAAPTIHDSLGNTWHQAATTSIPGGENARVTLYVASAGQGGADAVVVGSAATTADIAEFANLEAAPLDRTTARHGFTNAAAVTTSDATRQKDELVVSFAADSDSAPHKYLNGNLAYDPSGHLSGAYTTVHAMGHYSARWPIRDDNDHALKIHWAAVQATLRVNEPCAPATPVPTLSSPVQPILPDTTNGIHVALHFIRCYRPFHMTGTAGCNAAARHRINVLQGKIDLGFLWSYIYPPQKLGMNTVLGAAYNMDRATRGVYRFDKKDNRYVPVYRGYTWWKKHHPDWIEYQCNRKSPAYEFGDTGDVPLDIGNPKVLYYMFTHYVQRSVRAGFPLIFFDNVSMQRAGRCGHFSQNGKWVQQYSGKSNDTKYAHDALVWARYMYRHLKRYSPKTLLAFNLSIVPGNPSDYTGFVPYMDVDWDEAGFSRWGTQRITDSVWQQEIDAIRYSQARGKAIWLNYYTLAKSYSDLTRDEINWALANYLLVKGSATYVNINDADSGFFHDLPEYHAPIGSPTADMYQSQGVYMRDYSNGLVLVNPSSSQSYTVQLPRTYSDLYGNQSNTYTLAPASGIVLLDTPS